jgi:hypothetical protein
MVRGLAWWVLTGFLAFEVLASLVNFIGYREDPETYARVYRDPFLQQAVSHVFGLLSLVALYGQLRVRQGRGISAPALVYLVAALCFAVADRAFGIVRVCCT